MNFDGTVTIGTLLTVVGALATVISVIIGAVGAKFFPTKAELTQFRVGVGEQLATLRQDVHNAVAAAENVAKREAAGLERVATERHDRVMKDLERLEKSVGEALAGARSAQFDATAAVHGAAAAEKIAEGAVDNVDKAIDRAERRGDPRQK